MNSEITMSTESTRGRLNAFQSKGEDEWTLLSIEKYIIFEKNFRIWKALHQGIYRTWNFFVLYRHPMEVLGEGVKTIDFIKKVIHGGAPGREGEDLVGTEKIS